MLHHIIIISLVCTSVHLVTREGRLMHWFYRLCFRLPSWIKKPLYDCLLCMGGIWGLTLSWHIGYNIHDMILIAICVIALNGITDLIQSIFNVLQIICKRTGDT